MELLDHIREASRATAEAVLEHSHALRAYSLRVTPNAAPVAPVAISEPAASVSLREAVAAFLQHGLEEEWAVSTVNKREAMLEVLWEW